MAQAVTETRHSKSQQLAAALTKGPVEVLDFLLPLWAGAALGLSPALVGTLTAAETLVSFLIRPLAGVLADRFDRAKLAALGALGYAASFALFAVATAFPLALVAAMVGGAGGALFWVALRAKVGEDLPTDSGAFSKLFAAEGVGTWVAMVIAVSLVSRIDYRGVFWLCAAGCVAAAVVLFTLKSPPRAAIDPASPKLRELGGRMYPLLGVIVITAIAEAGVALLLLLHLQRGHNLQLGAIALVFLPGFIVYSTLPEYLHGVVTRLGRTRVVTVALLLSAVFAVGLSFAPHPVVLAGMWILSAAAFAAAIPVEQSVVAEAAGGSLGRGMAIYESATLLGATIGTFGAGLLYNSGSGWQIACVVAAVLLATAAVLVRGAIRRIGVSDRVPVPEPAPVAPAEVSADPVAQAPEQAGSAPAKPGAPTLNTWAGHAVIFLVAQVVLAVIGYSWPYEALFNGPHPAEWYWNSSGHLLLNIGRIWCAVFVIDTIYSVGRYAIFRLRNRG
ncbi:MFS transporter [Crossiella sp. CA198]|uniref:MFS transporter n=1 Tax=Crossiella sp. CA198 TaxID=3455607 RepID=UPI003F8D133C